jgi:adenylate kinase
MHIIFLGPPGSGKGTQSVKVEEAFKIPHISTGDIFRAAIANKTPAGLKAKEYVDKGMLVPDEVTIAVVEERLVQDDCKKGFLFDGFPRTIAQAEALEGLTKKLNIKLDAVIDLVVDKNVLLDRIVGRKVCPKCGASYHIKNMPPKKEGICDICGSELITRKDDNPEAMKIRLDAYEKETAPLTSYYEKKGLLKKIDALQDIDKVTTDILNCLKEK